MYFGISFWKEVLYILSRLAAVSENRFATEHMSLATKWVRRIKMLRGMVFITPALGALSTPIVSTKKTASPGGKSEPLR